MTPVFRRMFLLAAWLLPGAIGVARADTPSAANATSANKASAQAKEKTRIAVTISKETTFITEPLRANGYVDYVAALDQRFREGATLENNAAVLFWKAMGPSAIWKGDRDRYFQLLGIPPLPEKGDYFVDLEKYAPLRKGGAGPEAKSRAKADDPAWRSKQLETALKRPWSAQEYPILAKWLADNEKPLALVVEASKRLRRYDPLIGGKNTPMIAAPLPAYGQYSSVVRPALKARAMLRLGEGLVDGAWEDLLTCHRIARLVGQSPMNIDVMIAGGIDEAACAGDQVLLRYAPLTTAHVAKMRQDLDQLSRMPLISEMLNLGGRFEFLDVVSLCSKDGAKATLVMLEHLTKGTDLEEWKPLHGTAKSLVRHGDTMTVDWDHVLRIGNSWYDRIADACRKPTWEEQRAALREIEADFRKLRKTAENTASLDKSMLVNPRHAFSERLGQVLLIMFGPRLTLDLAFADRAAMRFDLDKLAFALAASRADQGSYPEKLADLVPKYVAELPKDVFNDAELRYRREGGGFVLYSVGTNQRDDGAKSYEDRDKEKSWEDLVKTGEDWDDLVVRVPALAVGSKGR